MRNLNLLQKRYQFLTAHFQISLTFSLLETGSIFGTFLDLCENNVNVEENAEFKWKRRRIKLWGK